MYQEFFGLHRRPFAVTPDPGCWHHEPPFQPALDELVVCCQQGQGIGILVGPAGAGKTLVCERIVRELCDEFVTVFLRHATFANRRALLQTILCERGRPFDKLTDTELRLGVSAVLNELHQHHTALVLIVDEAHHLSEAVLDELRILADQSRDGKPLVRLILSGQLSLEDKLASPGAEALNQRIRAHVILPALTRQESADYVDYRITWAGGRTDELFDPEALDSVCHAADGSPRCLNQLCDHALLLAYVKEEAPVSARTVLEALDDLRRLPLQWNAPPARPGEAIQPAAVGPVADHEPGHNSDEPTAIATECEATLAVDNPSEPPHHEIDLPPYRLGDRLDQPLAIPEPAPPAFADTAPLVWHPFDVPASKPAIEEDLHEEPVLDRYAALDAGLELPLAPQAAFPPEDTPVWSPADVLSAWWNEGGLTHHQLTDRLAAVQHVLDAVAAVDDEPLSDLPIPSPEAAALPAADRDTEDRLAATVLELATEAHESAQQSPAPIDEPAVPRAAAAHSAVYEIGADLTAVEPQRSPSAPAKSCRNLFTLLRRKQQGRA